MLHTLSVISYFFPIQTPSIIQLWSFDLYKIAEATRKEARKMQQNGKPKLHQVYDVKPFIENHPRGDEVLLSATGMCEICICFLEL